MLAKIHTIWKLFRIPNLLFFVLGLSLYEYCIIIPILNNHHLSPFFTPLCFLFFLLSIICIIAGGFCINDYFDISSDSINRPNNRIVGTLIPKKKIYSIYIIITVTGIVFAIYPTWISNNFVLFLCFPLVAILLWNYSSKYKRMPLIGNLLIAYLIAFSIIFLSSFEILHLKTDENYVVIKEIIDIEIFYAGFTFLIVLIREFIKMMGNTHGDSRARYNTLAVKIGIKKTKYITLVLIGLLIIAFIILALYVLLNKINLLFFLVLIGLILLSFALFYKTHTIRNSKNCQSASRLSKIIILMGVLSVIVMRSILLNP